MRIYCLPGLGTDHRLYERCDFGSGPITWLDWPGMPAGSTLADYARELAPRVDTSEPHVLIGTSMGGMVAQEMAAITRPRKVIIISSWKGSHERPPLIDMLGRMRAELLLNAFFLKHFVPTMRAMRWKLGLESKESQELVMRMMDRWSAQQLRVMIHACLSWKGVRVGNLVHIHGDRDALMPLSRIGDPIVVKGGTHMMVFNNGREVSALVRAALTSP